MNAKDEFSRDDAARVLLVSPARVSQLLRLICPATEAPELASPQALHRGKKVGRRMILRQSVEAFIERHERTEMRWREREAPLPRSQKDAGAEGITASRRTARVSARSLARVDKSRLELERLLVAALAANDQLTMAIERLR